MTAGETRASGMAHANTMFGISLATSLVERGSHTYEEVIEIVEMARAGLEQNTEALEKEAYDSAMETYDRLGLALGRGAQRALDEGRADKVSRDAPGGPRQALENSRAYAIAHGNSCLWLALVLSLRDGGILPEKEIERILGLAMTAAELEGFDEDAPASKAAEETIRGLAAVLLNDDDED